MFTEGVAARQLGCALANTRSLSVSALGTVCHLLEAERGNPRILLISARYPHYFPPSFGPFFFCQQCFLPPPSFLRPPVHREIHSFLSSFAPILSTNLRLPESNVIAMMDRHHGAGRAL